MSKIESLPQGASVFVGGGFVGLTPASFQLPAKPRVEIRLEFPGYIPYEDILIRRKGLPKDLEGELGVGWDEVYGPYTLIRKGY